MATRTDKLPSDIKWCVKRKRIPLAWSAHYDDARLICANYHNLFGGCLVVDNDRLEAIMLHLVDAERSVDSILSAMRAYHRHVLTDPYYRQEGRANPKRPAGSEARKDLASFLTCRQFDRFLEEGIAHDFEAKRDASLITHHIVPSTQYPVLSPAAEAALYAEYLNAGRNRMIELRDQAESELQQQGRRITHDSLRAKIVEILRRNPQPPTTNNQPPSTKPEPRS